MEFEQFTSSIIEDYFLGRLDRVAGLRAEEARCDPSTEERFRSVETDLIERFAFSLLSPEEERLFRWHMLPDNDIRQRVSDLVRRVARGSDQTTEQQAYQGYLRAAIEETIRSSAESSTAQTRLAGRLRVWVAEGAGKAGLAAQVMIEAVEGRTRRACEIVTDGLEFLRPESPVLSFPAVTPGLRADGQSLLGRSSVTTTDGNLRIEVSPTDGTIIVLAYRLESRATTPLVALVPLNDEAAPGVVQELEPDDRDPSVLRAVFSAPPGNYLVVLQPPVSAIAGYEAALRVYTEQEFPIQWAETQTRLGVAYGTLLVGNRAENLRRAMDCFEAAQGVYTERDFPAKWAVTQHNLGNAYSELPVGDRANNLHQAIACYEAALQIRTERSSPYEWATIQTGLGSAYAELPIGDRTENLRLAITCYEAALRIYTEREFPVEWARVQNNLGNARSYLPVGDRAENLRLAIASYEATLRVFTERDFPKEWGAAQNNLGIAHIDMPVGDTAENLRCAIACFEAALRVRSEGDFPGEWAMTQNNLASAYAELPVGDRAESLQRAIACHEAALRVYTEQDFPAMWAMTQINLASAYAEVPSGDPTENLWRALACYEAALRVYTERDFPADWAMTQTNLGNAYSELHIGDRAENLRRAITCYEAALRVRTERDFPVEWALTQTNLGSAYSDLPVGDSSENLRQAIACYEAALRVLTERDFPADWALTQSNLGSAYSDLPPGEHAENLRRAVAYYEAALRVRTRRDFPMDWAATQINLGIAYSDLPVGDHAENQRQAIACYIAALEVHTPDTAPGQCRIALDNLGRALFEREEWPGVLDTTERLLRLADSQRAFAMESTGRLRVSEGFWQPLVRGVTAAMRLNRCDTALQLSSRGKAQNLATEMARRDAHPRNVASEEWSAYQGVFDRHQILSGEYRRELKAPPGQRSNARLLEFLEQLRQLDEDRLEMEAHFAQLDPDYTPFARLLELPEWGRIAADCQAVLVDFRVTPEGSCLFLIGPGEQTIDKEQCITLPELTVDAVRKLTNEWLSRYYADRNQWREDLEAATGTLYQLILSMLHARVRERYPSVSRLVLFPNLGLNLLPLHAAWHESAGERRYFGDDYEISYAPSIQVLDRCLARQQSTPGLSKRLLALENPTLPFAAWEVNEAKGHFPPDPHQHIGPHAISKQKVLERMPEAEHLLFTTHGAFDPGNAEESAIEIDKGNGELLTAREIVNLDLRQAQMAVLSACETGLSDVGDLTDEHLGLPAAFLLAGVQTVIASQWQVEDFPTALLVGRLHENLYERRMGRAAALRAAQQWLRGLTAREVRTLLKGKEEELESAASGAAERMSLEQVKGKHLGFFKFADTDRPFANPYYWAAFFCFGAMG